VLMTCQDAREGSAALASGGLDLTGQALIHAHVSHCPGCRSEHERSPAGFRPGDRPSESRKGVAGFSTAASAAATRAMQAVATGMGHGRSALTRSAYLLVSLRTSLVDALSRFRRMCTAATAALVTRLLEPLPRLRSQVSLALSAPGRAAMRAARGAANGIGYGRTSVGAAGVRVAGIIGLLTRLIALLGANLVGYGRLVGSRFARLSIGVGSTCKRALLRAARATTAATRAGVPRGVALLPSFLAAGRALLPNGARPSGLRRRVASVRLPHVPLRASVGIASLGLVLAAMLLVPSERFSEEARRSADWMPAVAGSPAPGPVFAPAAGPLAIPRAQARPVTIRPRSAEGPAEVPPPVRSSGISLAQHRAAASAPTPSTEAAQNVDATDPAAAIDWLLQGGRGRRLTESP
jgi:hypothetical protein